MLGQPLVPGLVVWRFLRVGERVYSSAPNGTAQRFPARPFPQSGGCPPRQSRRHSGCPPKDGSRRVGYRAPWQQHRRAALPLRRRQPGRSRADRSRERPRSCGWPAPCWHWRFRGNRRPTLRMRTQGLLHDGSRRSVLGAVGRWRRDRVETGSVSWGCGRATRSGRSRRAARRGRNTPGRDRHRRWQARPSVGHRQTGKGCLLRRPRFRWRASVTRCGHSLSVSRIHIRNGRHSEPHRYSFLPCRSRWLE